MTRRLVALGDSISCGEGVGVGVDISDAWVGVLARAMDAELDVLAQPGVRTADIRSAQLPLALNRRATLATVLTGLNDMVYGKFDAAAVRADLLAIVGALRTTNTPVLLARLHDPTALIPTPRWLRRRLLERIDTINAAVDEARGPGLTVVDLAHIPALQTRGGWALDRVHPGLAGHRAMAAAAITELLRDDVYVPYPIDQPVVLSANSRLAEFRWLLGDGLPYLARKAREQHYKDWTTPPSGQLGDEWAAFEGPLAS